MAKGNTFSWFVSQRGRQFTFGATCALGAGILSLNVLPNTVFLNKYKEIVQSYKSGLGEPVSKRVLDRFNKALDILEVPQNERASIKPFTVFGFDMFSAGSTASKFGSVVGIPTNFNFESKQIVNKSQIQINNEQVDWTLPEAQQLLDALVLSENAQIFALAREIENARSLKFILDTSYPLTVLFGVYTFSRHCNQFLNFYERPVLLRLIFYTIIGLFGIGVYALLKDYTEVYYETEVDNKLAELDPILLEGGLEFYNKILERNIALRRLLGRNGRKLYSVYGNENFLIRQKRLPLTVRKLYFETKKKELSDIV